MTLLSLGPSVDVMGADVSEVDRGIVNSGAGPIHKTLDNNITQGDYDGRGQPTASPMLTAIMSGGVGIIGRELYKYR